MTRLNMRGLLALVLTVLTLGLGQVPASAQVIEQVPYLTSNPCKGVTLSLAFARSTGGNCLNGSRYASPTAIPGWTYSGGTPAGMGSYAAKADGSLQFFASNTNLQLYSEQFDNAQWSKGATTVTANAVTAPDGAATADKVAEGAVANTHYAASSSITVNTGAQYTHSFYLKAGERSYAAIYDGVKGQGKFFNLTTGAVGGNLVAAPDSAVISDAGNGWWRASITITASGSTTTPAVYLSTDGSSFNYLGTAGSGVYVWGGMTNLGTTAGTYIPTTATAVTVGAPRITDAGYWAEESRTNYLPTSAVPAGSGWIASKTANGITATKIATGTEFGLTYADYSFVGTASATSFDLGVAESTRTTASVGQTWTASIYGRVIAGTTNGVTSINYAEVEETTGNVYYGLTNSGNLPTDGSFSRLAATRTLAAATAASTRSTVILYIVSGQAVNITVRFYQPQLELGAYASSPIPTTSVAVTRSADMGSISPVVIPSAGTAFVEGVWPPSAQNVRILGVNGTTVTLLHAAPTGVGIYNGTTSMVGTPAPSSGAAFRGASTWTASGRSAVTNGNTVATDANTQPAMTRIDVGWEGGNTAHTLNAPLRRIVIYPRALGNAELQAATIGPVSFANDNAASDDMKAALWGFAA